VLTRKAEPGDVAGAGKVLLELAEAGETRIHATVDEKNLRLLKPGQKARAVADAFPGQPFDAELYYLAPAVDPLRGTVEIRFRVPAAAGLPAPRHDDLGRDHHRQEGCDPGAARRGGARPDGGKPWVLVANGRHRPRRARSPGPRGVGKVEIVEGLAEGDQAILPASGALEGDKVRVRPPASAARWRACRCPRA
jgi:HlyD family secretion protein